jgi:hypothetical protein
MRSVVRGIPTSSRCVLAAIGVAVAASASAEPYRLLSIESAHVRWQPRPGASRITLRYALVTGDIETVGARNCARMRPLTSLLQVSDISQPAFVQAVAQAFARWERVIDISFVEVSDTARAEIIIGAQSEPDGFAFANVVAADAGAVTVNEITSAQICLNPEKRWKVGFNGNLAVYDLVHTISHEIGHAIGLDHPDERGHLMSFRYHESRADLSEGDIRGALQLYAMRRDGPTATLAAPTTSE